MSSRMSETNSNDDYDGKAIALRQYEDTDGHFSLVRQAVLSLLAYIQWLSGPQEFPTCRSCHHHERCLWIVFYIFVGPIPHYERSRLSMVRIGIPPCRAHVRLFGWQGS